MTNLLLPDQTTIGPISAVFFDKDGTLIDSHSYWGTIISARACVIVDQLNLSAHFASSICDSMGFCNKTKRLLEKGPVALESRTVVVDKVLNHLRSIGADVNTKDINELFDLATSKLSDQELPVINPIPSALCKLKHLLEVGVQIAIVTSDTVSNTLKFIRQVDLDGFEIMVIGRDNYPHAKKSGLPAAFAANKLGVDIGHCLVIGDAPMDYLMAKNSGALHLLVSTGQLSYDTLRRTTNNVVKDLSEIDFTTSP